MPSLRYASLLALALCCALALAAPSSALVKRGAVAADVKLPDSAGRSHQLSELIKGKVALLVYWSLSCPHCQREMPRLVRLAKRFTGNPFVMLTVNADGMEMKRAVEAYAGQQRIPGPYLIDSGPGDALPFADAFDLFATPSLVVLDRAGKVVYATEAETTMEDVSVAVQAAFQSNP